MFSSSIVDFAKIWLILNNITNELATLILATAYIDIYNERRNRLKQYDEKCKMPAANERFGVSRGVCSRTV